MREITIDALTDNLERVLDFVNEELDQAGCPAREMTRIDIAVEEIFVNIAKYAYSPGTGTATVRVEVEDAKKAAVITFIDSGTPYDPLAKEDPDITLPAEERRIGGLGIFMVKKSMDGMKYEYKDGQNVLTITKNI